MRKEARLHTVNLVSFAKRAVAAPAEIAGIASTLDLSEHGIMLRSAEPIAKGDVLHLEFALAGEIVRTEARVMHVERTGAQWEIGLEFQGIAREDEAKVRRYLGEHRYNGVIRGGGMAVDEAAARSAMRRPKDPTTLTE